MQYLQLGPSVDLSDISQVFEVDDIFTSIGNITDMRDCSSEQDGMGTCSTLRFPIINRKFGFRWGVK